jgi:hypothetical protein
MAPISARDAALPPFIEKDCGLRICFLDLFERLPRDNKGQERRRSMPSKLFGSDFVTALGNYLGYGAIGLGLGVALLSAILLLSGKQGSLAAGTRFMMFALALVVIGSGLELVKAYEASAEAQRAFLASQNLPDEFWNDFLVARQQKMFGTAEPTDEYTSGSLKNGEMKSANIFLPKGECRFYFAAVRPPAGVGVDVKNGDSITRPLRDVGYYKTGKICMPSAKVSQEVELQVQARGEGQFSVSVFKAPPEEAAQAPASAPSAKIVKRVCTGEFEANCAGAHDAFYTCGYFGSDDAIAAQLCQGSPSKAVRINTKGGNKCGYSLIEVTCG